MTIFCYPVLVQVAKTTGQIVHHVRHAHHRLVGHNGHTVHHFAVKKAAVMTMKTKLVCIAVGGLIVGGGGGLLWAGPPEGPPGGGVIETPPIVSSYPPDYGSSFPGGEGGGGIGGGGGFYPSNFIPNQTNTYPENNKGHVITSVNEVPCDVIPPPPCDTWEVPPPGTVITPPPHTTVSEPNGILLFILATISLFGLHRRKVRVA